MIVKRLQEENTEALKLCSQIAKLQERELTEDSAMRVNHLLDDLDVVKLKIVRLKKLLQNQVYEAESVLRLAESCKPK